MAKPDVHKGPRKSRRCPATQSTHSKCYGQPDLRRVGGRGRPSYGMSSVVGGTCGGRRERWWMGWWGVGGKLAKVANALRESHVMSRVGGLGGTSTIFCDRFLHPESIVGAPKLISFGKNMTHEKALDNKVGHPQSTQLAVRICSVGPDPDHDTGLITPLTAMRLMLLLKWVCRPRPDHGSAWSPMAATTCLW